MADSNLVDIPKESALPKEKDKDAILGVPNFADNEETAAKVLKRIQNYKTSFDTQATRKWFDDRMDRADAMFRLAESQTKQDENKTRTEVDTIPGEYFSTLTTITSNENDVLFHGETPPVKYSAQLSTDEIQRALAEDNAWSQNRVLEYSMNLDGRVRKIKNAILFLNKYATGFVSMEWHQETKKSKERVPVSMESYAAGLPTAFKWQTNKEVKAHPTLKWHDMADVWFDSTISDMQDLQDGGEDTP